MVVEPDYIQVHTGIEFRADGITKQERNASAALLVENNLQSLSNRVLARVVEAGEEDDEALFGARGVAFTESLDHSTRWTKLALAHMLRQM